MKYFSCDIMCSLFPVTGNLFLVTWNLSPVTGMKKNTTCHRTFFLWKKEYFLSQEIYFLSQEIYFLWHEHWRTIFNSTILNWAILSIIELNNISLHWCFVLFSDCKHYRFLMEIFVNGNKWYSRSWRWKMWVWSCVNICFN